MKEIIKKFQENWKRRILEKKFKTSQLSWQKVHLDFNSEFVHWNVAKSMVILFDKEELIIPIRKLQSILTKKAVDLMFIYYSPLEDFSQRGLSVVVDRLLADDGSVNAAFIDRFKSKKWDIAVFDFDVQNIGLNYLATQTSANMKVTSRQELLKFANLQYLMSKKDENIIDYIINSIN